MYFFLNSKAAVQKEVAHNSWWERQRSGTSVFSFVAWWQKKKRREAQRLCEASAIDMLLIYEDIRHACQTNWFDYTLGLEATRLQENLR